MRTSNRAAGSLGFGLPEIVEAVHRCAGLLGIARDSYRLRVVLNNDTSAVTITVHSSMDKSDIERFRSVASCEVLTAFGGDASRKFEFAFSGG